MKPEFSLPSYIEKAIKDGEALLIRVKRDPDIFLLRVRDYSAEVYDMFSFFGFSTRPKWKTIFLNVNGQEIPEIEFNAQAIQIEDICEV